jgi:hypothetical protein
MGELTGEGREGEEEVEGAWLVGVPRGGTARSEGSRPMAAWFGPAATLREEENSREEGEEKREKRKEEGKEKKEKEKMGKFSKLGIFLKK